MRRAIGPILTTGVALAAAGVVVANPIIAPRADVQIPAVQLSAGSGDASAMLDQAFLDAIAPAPPESTNPFSVLRQLISSLAADATYLGKNAIVDAFVAGVTAVSQPELTASSTPYFPPLISSPELAASILPGLDLDTLVPLPEFSADLPAVSPPSTDSVAPVVQTLVSSVVKDAGFVGGQLVVAAFAAGAVVAAEPGLIGDTLQALITGDIAGALQTAVTAVAVTLGPPVIILNALRSVVEKNVVNVVTALNSVLPALTATAAVESDVPVTVTVAAAPTPLPAAPAPAAQAARGRGAAAPVAATPGESADAPALVGSAPQPAAVTAASTRAQSANSLDSEPSATEAATNPAPATEKPRPSLRDAVETVGQQIGAAVSAVTSAAAGGSAANGVGRTHAARAGS